MREVRISDAEMRRLIAEPLVAHLRKNGLQTGAGSDEQCSIAMPIFLDLAGAIEIVRTEDGVWTFRQELSAELSDRTDFALRAHAAAVEGREARQCP